MSAAGLRLTVSGMVAMSYRHKACVTRFEQAFFAQWWHDRDQCDCPEHWCHDRDPVFEITRSLARTVWVPTVDEFARPAWWEDNTDRRDTNRPIATLIPWHLHAIR